MFSNHVRIINRNDLSGGLSQFNSTSPDPEFIKIWTFKNILFLSGNGNGIDMRCQFNSHLSLERVAVFCGVLSLYFVLGLFNHHSTKSGDTL